jgi:hypothetical protein
MFVKKYPMRATDDRYRNERIRLELALRLISHEARTGTIRHLTDLSDDRIRKLYGSYFKHDSNPVRRRRGKSPSQITPLVRTRELRLESSALVALMASCGVLDGERRPTRSAPHARLELGQRLCQTHETYLAMVNEPRLSFEALWNLYRNIVGGDELGSHRCDECQSWYVYDALALTGDACPLCQPA